jgi:hypothetical protein
MSRARSSSPQIQDLDKQLRKNTALLYSQILKYQINLACQYSRAGFFRFLRDVIVADNWKDMLQALKATEENIRRDLNLLDRVTLDKIDLDIASLHGKADGMLAEVKEVRTDIKV